MNVHFRSAGLAMSMKEEKGTNVVPNAKLDTNALKVPSFFRPWCSNTSVFFFFFLLFIIFVILRVKQTNGVFTFEGKLRADTIC